MSTSPSRTCPVCEQPLGNEPGPCPGCSASPAWQELADAYAFARRRFEEWHDAGRISLRDLGRIQEHYALGRERLRDAVRRNQPIWQGVGLPRRTQCWSCRDEARSEHERCPSCGVIWEAPGVRSLRYWHLLRHEINLHQQGGRLSLPQAHELENEVRERMKALRGRLELDRVAPAYAATRSVPSRGMSEANPAGPALEVHTQPSRPILEILLDPQSIQWLLASGGVLLVLGLVIWLTSLGLFQNPKVVAAALGAGNAALLAGGFALIQRTRFQLAGRALTLLACLAMPLNLWFYHAQGLVTLQDHLWVAALVCCVVYAAAAAVLRDRLFVYVLCAGVTLTGLLLLGDLNRFDEILAPSILLVVLGLVALHLERAFPDIDSPFSRRRFGMAFFWCAQVLLGAGLLLLLGAQLTGWLPLWREWGMDQPPAVVQRDYLGWTIMLALAGTYAYLWSDLVVRRVGLYIYLAAVTLLWAEVQLLALLNLTDLAPVVIITLALTAVTINLIHTLAGQPTYTRAVPPLGLALSLVSVAYGVLLHFRATNLELQRAWRFELDWSHVGAMVVAALACRAGAYLYRRTAPTVSAIYFFGTAAATLVAAAGLAWMLGLQPWETQAPLLMLIPIAYMIAARLYRGHTPEEPLAAVAHASTVVMIVCSIFAALDLTQQVVAPIEGATQNLLYALFCAEAALFYGLAASLRKESWNVYLATAMFCGALWQLLIYWQMPHETYTVAFSLAGIALLVVYRLAVLESTKWSALAGAAFQSANGLLSLGFLAGALLALGRLALTEPELAQLAGGDWRQPLRHVLYVLILLGGLALVAALLVRHGGWRRWYLVLAVADAALVVAILHKMSLLSPWQKLEIFSILLGLALVAVGLVGWYRESERASELVSFCLFLGSLLAAAPLVVAVIVHRYRGSISALDELGLVLVGVTLLGLGIVCRLKATTLVGVAALTLHILIVIVHLHRYLEEQLIVGIYLTIGGGLLFATGLVLSLYRDRLLALPDRIKRREGVFKILNWR